MITASIVPIAERPGFFPSITSQYIHFESAMFNFARNICDGYDGGYWEFVELSNGGKFAYPKLDQSLVLKNPSRCEPVQMTAEAAGICITHITLSAVAMVAWRDDDKVEMNRLSVLVHLLDQYVKSHPEREKIEAIAD
ncbi:antirestriction protein [Vibrio sp. WXL210]|uniref:antirestriction protein n=1 Tax=Vibrio sp. WXL210 TaxID=3450709 RepID=UPI003EC88C81